MIHCTFMDFPMDCGWMVAHALGCVVVVAVILGMIIHRSLE